MSLYRVGSTWYLDIPTAKGRLRASTRTADKKAAQEYHDKVKADLWRHEKLGEPLPVTWAEAVAKWLSVKPRGLPDRYRLRALDLEHEPLPLPAGTVDELLEGMAAGSRNRVIALIGAVHRTSGIEPPAVDRGEMSPSRTRWLSAEEWEKLLKALKAESPLLAQCARFAVATGLRENNVLNLRWSQVDLGRAVAYVEAAETKQRQPIGIPLPPDAVAILRERRGLDKVYVFAHPDSGKPLYKASNRAWYTALRRAKMVGFRWHDLRHTWASWAVQSGVRIEELMELGGWKTLSMVKRYSHLSPGHLAAVAAKIRPVKRGRVTNTS